MPYRLNARNEEEGVKLGYPYYGAPLKHEEVQRESIRRYKIRVTIK